MHPNNKIPPEIIIENTITYAIQAEEILQQINLKEFNLIIAPPWPHYYTGVLQASSYFLYKKKAKQKKIALIFSQKTKNKKISIPNEKIWPFLGYTRTPSNKIWLLTKKYHNIQTNKIQKDIELAIFEQLPFIRTITQITDLLPIFIDPQTPTKEIIPILKDIQKTHTIFFITSLNSKLSIDKCKADDQILVKQILNQKLTKKTIIQFPLIELFVELSKTNKKTPQSVAYLNSGNFWWDKKNTTGYANIIV